MIGETNHPGAAKLKEHAGHQAEVRFGFIRMRLEVRDKLKETRQMSLWEKSND